MDRNNLCAAYHTALSSLRCILALRHVSREKLCQAALDITIVAFGIRTGYLFDAFAIRDRRISLKDVLVEYLAVLRKADRRFENAVIVYEPHAEQLFFVNTQRLRDLLSFEEPPRSTTSTEAPSVIYIALDGSQAQVTEPPAMVKSLMHTVTARTEDGQAPPMISLIHEGHVQDIGSLVAFAACLLDFPVAYVPTSGGDTAYLAGVPLDVYECSLVIDNDTDALRPYELPRRHTVTKFSCPQHVAQRITALSPETMAHNLRTRLEVRLQAAGFPGRVVVKHSTETLDRVAL
ncbi:hypothetical protein C8Q70DRAFT_613835 [Cubamyces menziesii]|nr:hypothetical protein C8Q70DRAFT_613835 [Cubamyces menziesii]